MSEHTERETGNLRQLLSDAKVLFTEGRVEDAAQTLSTLLESRPHDAEGINLLGLVRLQQQGPTDEVAELFEKAVLTAPSEPVYRNNLGSIYWQKSRFDAALEQFEAVLAQDPQNTEALLNCGNTYRSLGRGPEAERALTTAAALEPHRVDIHTNLGGLLYAMGRHGEAIEILEHAVTLDSSNARCLGNLGLAYSTVGQLARAEECYRRALQIVPGNAGLHGNLSSVLYRQGRLDDAISECRRAILIDPQSPQAYNNLGIALRDGGRTAEAVATLRLALERQPDSPGIFFNLGIALHDRESYAEAAECFEKALASDPNWPIALVNLGNAYYKLDRLAEARETLLAAVNMGRHPFLASASSSLALVLQRQCEWNEALRYFDLAIRETPDHATARFGRSMLLLKLGDFARGWRDYEWRFDATRFHYLKTPDWQTPEWNGEPLQDKTLLVYHEQGLGDGIHFVRYLPRLKSLGAKVLMLCGPPLFRLFDSMGVIDEFHSRKEKESLPVTGFDYHVPLKTLPRIFGTRIDSVPADVPYLDAPPEAVANWRSRISKDTFNIGIAWAGNPDQGDDRHRSCELRDFEPVVSIPGTRIYSLQKGNEVETLRDGSAGSMVDRIVDFTEELTDFADTAALIKCLDLVITVDTSVAHLSGALAKPVWTVLWTNHCWRYLLDRTDSPWYPTMTLYKQTTEGNWGSVFDTVARDLRQHIQTHGRNRAESA